VKVVATNSCASDIFVLLSVTQSALVRSLTGA
jgi:hypothetical protein